MKGNPMNPEGIKRKLAAIMSADVKGYSCLMSSDEMATIQTLTACRGIIFNLIQQYQGRVVDDPGDNILAEFSSVIYAVQSAVAIQKELKARNAGLPDNQKMEFRIGINLGDIIVEGQRIYGDGVNIAARLERLSDPGGICISRAIYDQIKHKLPFGYENLGEKKVKNITRPLQVYKVLIEPDEVIQRSRPNKHNGRRDRERPLLHFLTENRFKRNDGSKRRPFKSFIPARA